MTEAPTPHFAEVKEWNQDVPGTTTIVHFWINKETAVDAYYWQNSEGWDSDISFESVEDCEADARKWCADQ